MSLFQSGEMIHNFDSVVFYVSCYPPTLGHTKLWGNVCAFMTLSKSQIQLLLNDTGNVVPLNKTNTSLQ